MKGSTDIDFLHPDSVPSEGIPIQVTVEPEGAKLRLDHFLLRKFPDHTRSFLNKLIHSAHVLVDNKPVKPGVRLHRGQCVQIVFPSSAPVELVPEPVDFTLLFEDEHLIVLVKPPGVVVHPAAGHHTGTLVHGLLHHCADLPLVASGRPGIVHRLDKDTSGLMLVAKSERALHGLTEAFQARDIKKSYVAILLRTPSQAEAKITGLIGRHPVHRKKMAVCSGRGKYAATTYRVMESFANGWCLVDVSIETGRTHQIRVHMASLHCPIAGDTVYGGAIGRREKEQPARQMLHAHRISFTHPISGASLSFTAPLWPDMQKVLEILKKGPL